MIGDSCRGLISNSVRGLIPVLCNNCISSYRQREAALNVPDWRWSTSLLVSDKGYVDLCLHGVCGFGGNVAGGAWARDDAADGDVFVWLTEVNICSIRGPVRAHNLLEYMVIAEWQRRRYVANEGTLHLDHIYLDVMRSVIKKLWKLWWARKSFHHLSI